MNLSTSWIIGGTLATSMSSALEWRVSWGFGAGSKSLLGAKVLGTLRDIIFCKPIPRVHSCSIEFNSPGFLGFLSQESFFQTFNLILSPLDYIFLLCIPWELAKIFIMETPLLLATRELSHRTCIEL